MKIKIFALIIVFSSLIFAQLNGDQNNRFRLAQSYQQAGEFEKAKSIYENLYSKNPESYQIFEALNNVYIFLKEYDSSIQLIELRLKNSPEDVNLYGMLGSTYYLMGNEQKAFAMWDEAAKKIKPNSANFRTLANYAIERRAFDKAAEYLTKGRDIAKDPKYFSYDLANIYSITMQFKKAAEEYCRVLSNDPNQLSFVQSRIFTYINKPDALQQTIEVVQNYPDDNINFKYLLARLLIENKNYEEAFDIYRDIDSKQNNQGAELYNFAQMVFNEKQFNIAAEAYNELINKYPDSKLISSAKLGYARTLEENFNKENTSDQQWKPFYKPNFNNNSNEEEKVISAYLELPKIYPHSEVAYEAYLHIGRIKMYRQNKLDDAQIYFKKIIDESPLSRFAASAYAELGRISILKNDLENAKLYYSKILNSNNSEQTKNYASYQLARIYFFQNNFNKAREILNKILNDLKDNSANDAIEFSLLLNTSKKDSSNLSVFASAELLAEQRKFEEASEEYKKIASNPQAFVLQDISELRQAEMQLALNNLDSTLSMLKRISDEGEKNIYGDKALYLQGKIYQFALSDDEKAVKIYEELLAKFPNSLYLNDARDEIIKLRKTS